LDFDLEPLLGEFIGVAKLTINTVMSLQQAKGKQAKKSSFEPMSRPLRCLKNSKIFNNF